MNKITKNKVTPSSEVTSNLEKESKLELIFEPVITRTHFSRMNEDLIVISRTYISMPNKINAKKEHVQVFRTKDERYLAIKFNDVGVKINRRGRHRFSIIKPKVLREIPIGNYHFKQQDDFYYIDLKEYDSDVKL